MPWGRRFTCSFTLGRGRIVETKDDVVTSTPVLAFGPLSMLICLIVSLTGCKGLNLPPTPHLFLHAGNDRFEAVDPAHQNPFVDVIYATDRKKVASDEQLSYGADRSASLAVIDPIETRLTTSSVLP